MAEISSPTPQTPVTEASLLAERMTFWSSFTNATTKAAVAVVLLVVAMWFFLV